MIRFLAVIAVIGLAGCAQSGEFGNGDSIGVAGQGQMTGSESKTLDCGSRAQVAVGFQGQGTIEVQVTDGAGTLVYTKSFQGGGQSGETKEFSGAAGQWTLTVTFSGLYGGYQGQYGIYLRC